MVGLILKLRLSVSIFVFLIFFSCKKQGHYLPAMTREGRNTIGFINAEGEIFGGSTNQINYSGSNQLLSFNFKKTISGWNVKYEYLLNLELKYDELVDSFKFQNATYTAKYYDYGIDSSEYNNFEVTYFDKAKRILSGNFEFNMACIDTINNIDTIIYDTIHFEKINRGRFDIRYPD